MGASRRRRTATASFVLEGLGPDSTVSITSRFRDRQSKSPLQVRAGEAGSVKVTITPRPVLAVAGRVLGPGGTPLGGIPVKVQFRIPRDNFQGFPETAQFDEKAEITTAPDGTFQTPKELERKPSEFRIEVIAEGFLPARTAWVPVPASGLLTLPDLTLKRSRGVRTVSGRVVDRDGKPVPGASVSQGAMGRGGHPPKPTPTVGSVCTGSRAARAGLCRCAGLPVRGNDC